MEITNRVILLAFIKKHTDAIAPVNKWIELVENNKFTGHNELKAFFIMPTMWEMAGMFSISRGTGTGL